VKGQRCSTQATNSREWAERELAYANRSGDGREQWEPFDPTDRMPDDLFIIDTHDPAPVVTSDPVAWPSHYMAAGQYECREVIAALGLNHPRGNAFKYLWRAGRKEGADEVQDLRKARECIDFDIKCQEAKRR